MYIDEKELIDELARAIFDTLKKNGGLKLPAPIAVSAGMSDGRRRTVRRSETTWQDYRREARMVLQSQGG